jgi:hypothetical protein
MPSPFRSIVPAGITAVLICTSRFVVAQASPPAALPEAAAPAPDTAPAAVAPPVPPPASVAAPTQPPPVAHAAMQPVDPPAARSAWHPRDARVAISLDHIFSFEAVAVQTYHDSSEDGSSRDETRTRSAFPFQAGDFAQVPRLAVDGLFGGTVGAFVGYGRSSNKTVYDDGVSGPTDDGERSSQRGLAGVRAGAIIGRGSTVALWLRGNVGYTWTSETPSDDAITDRAVLLALDPVVIFSPLAHVALTVGPYVEASRGWVTFRTAGVADPGDHTWFDVTLRFVTNLSFMF